MTHPALAPAAADRAQEPAWSPFLATDRWPAITRLAGLFGSVPFRQLAGPMAGLFFWPARPSRRVLGKRVR